MVKTLQHDVDIVTIAHLLATLLQKEHFVKGKDNIGLGLEEIEILIERAMSQRGGGDRNRRRGGGGGGGGYRGNRSSNGSSRSRNGRNGRSSGGRSSRNGGQGSRS